MSAASPFCHNVIAAFEVFMPVAYVDAVGKQTIGFGHVILPEEQEMLNATLQFEDAKRLLAEDVAKAYAAVNEGTDGLPLLSHELDALTSFTFNCGGKAFMTSTLLKKLHLGERQAAAWQFNRWIHGGGKVLPGLVRRRHAESVWFLGAAPETVLYLANEGWRK